jgi:serine/threonine protein kinase
MANTHPEKIGRYQILERVGKGGMGVLYRGIDPVLDREVAIKVMLVDFSDDTEQMRPRFYREAQAAAKLQHSNIVTIFEFAEDNNTPYIVMEFLRGTGLDARMAAPLPLTLDDKLNVVSQLCSALNYAHSQGVVHRDIKPANLFLLPDGTVKLLDFGVAKLTSSTLTKQGDVIGSVSYMSPEQLSGSDAIDGRSDIFSAGVVLYELLTGRKPFKGDSPTGTIVQILREEPPPVDEIVPGTPTQLSAVVRKALAKDVAERYATAGELGRDLQVLRRNLQTLQDASSLDETRFASQAELAALQQQLNKDASAKVQSTPPSPQPARHGWLTPAGAAAFVIVVVAAFIISGMRDTSTVAEDGAAVTSRKVAVGSATPAAVTERTSQLRVESAPPGADVLVNGRGVGEVTPAPVTLTGAGPFKLRIAKRGFVAQEVLVSEDDLARGTLAVTLSAAEVQRVAVTVSSAYPVEVLSGSQTLAVAGTAHQLSVPAGSRLRIVARDLMLDEVLAVTAKPVQYNTPSVGRLTVLTKFETCNVKIGDRMVGFPPITRMPIVAGQYRVDIVCQSGTNPPGQFVTVPANDTATVRIY